jgi:hypothetical protein
MLRANHRRFLQFLQNDLDLSPSEIAVATKLSQRDLGPLSVALWHYGLVTLEQLNLIFDWLERDQLERCTEQVTLSQ